MSDSQTHVQLRIDSPSKLRTCEVLLRQDGIGEARRDVFAREREREREVERDPRDREREETSRKVMEEVGREERRREEKAEDGKFTMCKKRQITRPASIITSSLDGNYRSEREGAVKVWLMRDSFGRPPLIIAKEDEGAIPTTLYISSGGGQNDCNNSLGIEQWPPTDFLSLSLSLL